jgi:site-specific recombinase XerD
MAHADDVDNRDPRKTGREDVKGTLRRWPHPNSQSKNRSILVAFYDWMLEEGMRETNPARHTPPEAPQADRLPPHEG